jgi:hypothetical protein
MLTDKQPSGYQVRFLNDLMMEMNIGIDGIKFIEIFLFKYDFVLKLRSLVFRLRIFYLMSWWGIGWKFNLLKGRWGTYLEGNKRKTWNTLFLFYFKPEIFW